MPNSVVVQAVQAALLGDCATFPDCRKTPDAHDDPANLSGKNKKDCPKGLVENKGGHLHVSLATGAVWTDVPILTTYGEGDVALEITLTYNSLLAFEDRGFGKGWNLALGDAARQAIPLYYYETAEQTHSQPNSTTNCTCVCIQYANSGLCGPTPEGCISPSGCIPDPDIPIGCSGWFCSGAGQSHIELLVPGRVVVVDSDGRRNSYSRYVAGYWNSPNLEYEPGTWRHLEHLFPPPNRNAELYDLYAESPPSDYSFRMDADDGTKYFFKSVAQDSGGMTTGVLKKVVYPKGDVTELFYGHPTDAAKPTLVRDRFGREIELVWNGPGGRLSSIIQLDAATQQGFETEITYQSSGSDYHLQRVEDPLNHETSFSYDSNHRITQETVKNGRVFSCSYADFDTTLTQATTEGQGNMQARTLTAYNQATSAFDHLLTLAIERPTSGPPKFPATRDSQIGGGHMKFKNGNGFIWDYYRDGWGRIYRQEFVDSSGIKYQEYANYDASSNPISGGTLGRLMSYSNSYAGCLSPSASGCSGWSGLVKDYTWDSSGRLDKIDVEVGTSSGVSTLTTDYSYVPDSGDPAPPFADLPTHKVLPNGADWKYLYHPDTGDVTDIIGPVGSSLSATTHYAYTYDTNKNYSQIVRTNRRGFTTTYTYGSPGNLTHVVTDLGNGKYQIRDYTYNYQGQRVTETIDRGDGTSTTTKFEYDAMGRMTAVIENYVAGVPANDTTNMTVRHSYDGDGLLMSTTNPREIRIEYEYDHRNWLIKTTVDAGSGAENLNLVTNYERDGNGNIKKLTKVLPDSNDQITEFWFDAADNVIQEKDAEGYFTTYQRDGGGNVSITRRQRVKNDELIFSVGDTSTIVSITGHDGLGRMTLYQAGSPSEYYREYDYSGWATGGGGCSCTGLGTGVARKVTSNAPGEVKLTFNEVDLLGRVNKVIRKLYGTSSEPTEYDPVTSYTYDAEGNLEEIHGPMGEFTELDYDGADRLTKRTVHFDDEPTAQDLVTEYTYNGVDRITSVKLPTTKEMTYQYDPADRLKKVLDGTAALAEYSYDANGNQIERKDGEGNKWNTEFDRLDRPHVVTDPLTETPTDKVATFDYDSAGNLRWHTNNANVRTCYMYDRLNRLLCMVEDCNPLTMGTGEGRGELDGNSEGGVQAIEVIGDDDPNTTTGTENTWTCYIYDGRFLVGLEDHDYNQTQYEYDQAGRVTDVFYPWHTTGNSDTVHYVYSATQIERLEQRGIHTYYNFNPLGHLIHRQYISTSTDPIISDRNDYFEYDKSGRLKLTKDQNQVIEWERTYDLAGRPNSETQYFDGTNPHIVGIGHNLDTTAKTLVQSLCYPPAGNCTPPASRTVSRTFDARLRLSKVDSGASLYESWDYDGAGRRAASDRANGIADEFTYDVNSRLTKVGWRKAIEGESGFQEVASQEYGYDAMGNRLYTRMSATSHLALPGSDHSQLYNYDNRNRLTTMTRGTLNAAGTTINPRLTDPVLTNKQQWTDLDRRGNWLDYRVSQKSSSTATTLSRKQIAKFSGVNEIACLQTGLEPISLSPCTTQPDRTPAYDAAGNMLYNPLGHVAADPFWCGPTTMPSCPTGHDLAYDVENRVVAICKDTDDGLSDDVDWNGVPDEPKLLEFRYDSLGRRILTIEYVDPQTGAAYLDGNYDPAPRLTRHVYHDLEVVQEYTCIGQDDGIGGFACGSTWTLAREFVWGDSARFPEPIAMVDYTGANGVSGTGPWIYHFLRDVLGSVVGLTDASGNLIERYTYDPYGKTFIEKWDGSAWAATSASSFGNPFGWTGQRYDAATGTYHFLFRTYSPTMGRWLQRDPVGYVDGVSLYALLNCSPINGIDPLGLCSDKSTLDRVAELIRQANALDRASRLAYAEYLSDMNDFGLSSELAGQLSDALKLAGGSVVSTTGSLALSQTKVANNLIMDGQHLIWKATGSTSLAKGLLGKGALTGNLVLIDVVSTELSMFIGQALLEANEISRRYLESAIANLGASKGYSALADDKRGLAQWLLSECDKREKEAKKSKRVKKRTPIVSDRNKERDPCDKSRNIDGKPEIFGNGSS